MQKDAPVVLKGRKEEKGGEKKTENSLLSEGK